MTNQAEMQARPAPTTRDSLLGHLALGGSVLGIGSAFIFVRLSEVDATSTLMLRMVAASAVLGACLAPRGLTPRLRATRGRDLGLLMAAGVVSGLDLLANQWAVNYTSVANAAFLMNTSPVFVILLTWLLYRERVAASKLVAVLIALVGGALVIIGGGSAAPGGFHLLGDGLALSSAALYAASLLMTKQLRERVPTTVIMIVNSLTIAVLLGPVAWATSQPLLPQSAGGYLLIFTYALVSQLMGHGLMTYALRTVDPTLASMSGLLRPVVAAVLAWLILGEGMGVLQLVGGLVLLIALGVFQRAGSGRRRPPATPPADATPSALSVTEK